MRFSHCVPYLTSIKYHSDLENRTACSLVKLKFKSSNKVNKKQNNNHLEEDNNSTEVHASSQNNMKIKVRIQME
jgi:hypothetical protein